MSLKKLRVYAQVLETRARVFVCVYSATTHENMGLRLGRPSHLDRWRCVSRRSFLSNYTREQ